MIQRLSQHSIRNRRVLVRVDFNVPIVRGRIAGDFRLQSHIPTVRRLASAGNQIILLSHHSDRTASLRPAGKAFAKMLGRPVRFLTDPLKAAKSFSIKPGEVVLFENLRHWKGEESSDQIFAKILASFGHVFVNDAFSVAHRKAASTVLLPKLLPSYLGLLFEREIAELDRLLKHPKRPLVAVFGGAKVETKLALLNRFRRIADRVLVGGALANEILVSRGVPIRLNRALPRALLRSVRSFNHSKSILLPEDLVRAVGKNAKETLPVAAFSRNGLALDIGSTALREFARELARAKTIVWNGPMGLVEDKRFRAGTEGVARAIKRSRARSVIGGGDTLAFLGPRGLHGFDYVSTGGGAMLAYLGGEKLPALEALRRSKFEVQNTKS